MVTQINAASATANAARQRILDAQGRPNYSSIIQPTLQYELCNSDNKAVEFAYDNCTYRIPAAHEHWVGRDPGSGEIITYPVMGVMPVWTPPPNRKYSARDIVEFVVGKDGRTGKLGVRGVRILFGEEEEVNKLVRAESRDVYLNHKMTVVNTAIAEYEASVQDDIENGRPRRSIPQHIREYYEERHAWSELPSTMHMCPVCNMPKESENAIWTHVLVFHKDKPMAIQEATEALNAQIPDEDAKIRSRKMGAADEPADPMPTRGRAPTAEQVKEALDDAAAGLTGDVEPRTASQVSATDPASLQEQQVREAARAQARAAGNKK